MINQQVSYRPFCWLPFLLGLIVTTTQGSKQIKMRGVSVSRHNGMKLFIGKSLSEALIFASTNPQYNNRLFIFHEKCKPRITAEHVVYTNCCFCFDIQNNFGTQHVLRMLRTSEKDLPVILPILQYTIKRWFTLQYSLLKTAIVKKLLNNDVIPSGGGEGMV